MAKKQTSDSNERISESELRDDTRRKILKLGDSRVIRKVNPLGMRVLVRLRRENDMTEGGLYLPEGAKQALSESMLVEVVEVASAIDQHTDEEANISGIPLGSLVLIQKQAGVKVPWDEELRIVETKDILAIVSQIEVV